MVEYPSYTRLVESSNLSIPTNAALAQLVAQLPCKQRVQSSSLWGGIHKKGENENETKTKDTEIKQG